MTSLDHTCLTVRDLPRSLAVYRDVLGMEVLFDDALVERLRQAGGTFFSQTVVVDAGASAGSRGVYVRDPEGVILELFQPR
jgi:catechol 2,3-dioxygenase-like lactoylglutathione lyase family enzyme